MAALIALLIGVLFACGVYLILQRRTFPVLLGLTLASYGTNLFLLSTGNLAAQTPAILREGAAGYADPLPQALVLTAIVIGFGMTAFLTVLALRARITTGTDHVDGENARAERMDAPEKQSP